MGNVNSKKLNNSGREKTRGRYPRLRTDTIIKNKDYLRELHQAGRTISSITPLQVLQRGNRPQLNLTVALIINCINRNFNIPIEVRQKMRPYKVHQLSLNI